MLFGAAFLGSADKAANAQVFIHMTLLKNWLPYSKRYANFGRVMENWITVLLSFLSAIIAAIGTPFAAFHVWKVKMRMRENSRIKSLEMAIDGLNAECFEILEKFAIEGDGIRMRHTDAVKVLCNKSLLRCAYVSPIDDRNLYVMDDLARNLVRERLAQSQV